MCGKKEARATWNEGMALRRRSDVPESSKSSTQLGTSSTKPNVYGNNCN